MEKNLKFNDKEFMMLIMELYKPLCSSIKYAYSLDNKNDIINTDFLGRSNSAATRLEEVLDHYNAKNNSIWRPFREHIAAIKRFTDVSYITLHLKYTSPQYKLLSGINTFLDDTDEILNYYTSTLFSLFPELTKSAETAGLNRVCPHSNDSFKTFVYPEGRLDSDFKKSRVDKPEKVIVSLATSYLNLESESILLKQIQRIQSSDYTEVIPDIISEDAIRILESKFHNLQSLYDTYISNTDLENLDTKLKLIRGHASIVYHLLEAAAGIIHYYERHMMPLTKDESHEHDRVITAINAQKLLDILVNYYLNYSEQFLTAGKTLCKEVIQKYAEEGSINVRVPQYRGFHVRPSTLIAKIVHHYGSDVYLILGNEKFDASSPMNLFRVNEKITAEKRRSLAFNISSLDCVSNFKFGTDFKKGLKEIFIELLKQNKIINYSTKFSLPELKIIPEESLGEYANRVIAKLLAQGKIDLKTDIEVTFQGDKRVLTDIAVLAECGYGEDNYGNNTILPEELSYIRR